jgi:NAD(P)-dependent dehydrogenase (short-subunit alcohol dehydrogenase family)
MDAFVKEFGRIDILVNNAGMSIPKPFLEKTAEEWIKTLEVNLIGVFLCSQAAAKHMLPQKSGKIINISSIRGIDHCGREGIMDYSAAKAGVINLTKTMAKELAPYINVNTVAPGHTLTEMTAPISREWEDPKILPTPFCFWQPMRRIFSPGSFFCRTEDPA